jgi:hypothetical protein
MNERPEAVGDEWTVEADAGSKSIIRTEKRGSGIFQMC